MPATPLEPAGLLFAHYEVLREEDGSPCLLGMGGMGMTYKARDTRLDLLVALKVIHPLHVAHPNAQRMFLREARAAARVIHANVAPVVYLHDEPGKFFYAMEFVDGVSLDAFLRERGPLPAAQALGLAEQVARGLGAINEQGLIHRDLKPANVMVTRYPPGHARHRALAASGGCALKIIDFGLARAIEPAHFTDEPLTIGFRGTAAYASPEQCEERADLDARSDLYALGCITWQMLCGRPPFKGRSQMELARQHCEAPLPWEALPGLDPAVRAVLECLLAKDRDQRPPDAVHAAEMLAQAAAWVGAASFVPQTPLIPGFATTVAPTPSRLSSSGAAAVARAATPLATPAPVPATEPRRDGRRLAWIVGAILLLGLAGAVWWRPPKPPTLVAAAAATTAAPRVLAVLPFVNASDNSDGDFLAAGIHEDVVASLAKVPELRVLSRAAVSKYRGRPNPARDVAKDTCAALVLEGTVRRVADRVLVTARLVDTSNDQQIWADQFERAVADLFEIQAAVATEIASTLAVNFSQGGRALIARRPTANRDAYEVFLRARSLRDQRESDISLLDQMVAFCERAVRLDPEFALAWAMLARTHAEAYWLGRDRSPARLAKAREAAQRAVQLQPDLPEARLALGDIRFRVERDWEGAMAEYRVALAIEPNNAAAHEAAAYVQRRMGRWAEALQSARLAAALAPDDATKHILLGSMLGLHRLYAESIAAYRRAQELSENPGLASSILTYELEITGDWAAYERGLRAQLPRSGDEESRIMKLVELRDFLRALAELRALPDLNWQGGTLNTPYPKELEIAQVLRFAGQADEARRLYAATAPVLAERVQASPEDAWLRMKWAHSLAGAGEAEAALREAEAALRLLPESRDALTGSNLLILHAQLLGLINRPQQACDVLDHLLARPSLIGRERLRYFPEWDILRGHPRFEQILSAR